MIQAKDIALFQFTWKSMKRNPGRIIFVSLSVSLSVIVSLWIYAFLKGFGEEIERAVVNTNTGFYQIQEINYARTTDSSHLQLLGNELKLSLEKNVLSYSPELVMDGNVVTPEGAASLRILGIIPTLHQSFLPISKKMIEGAFIQDHDEDVVVIGQELARLFKWKTGDQLILNYQDKQGDLSSEILGIKGIFHFNSRGFEKRHIYITQKTWQKLYLRKISDGLFFNRIPMMVKDLLELKKMEQEFSSSTYVLKTWRQINPEMAVITDFQMAMIKLFFVMIGITVLMTILNPVQMAWQERLRELKVLNILGLSPSEIWKMGFFEVIFMTIVSGLTAAFVLIVVLGIQSQTGVDFSAINQGVHIERGGIIMPRFIYPSFDFSHLGAIFFALVLIFGLSYVYAIRGALKKLNSQF